MAYSFLGITFTTIYLIIAGAYSLIVLILGIRVLFERGILGSGQPQMEIEESANVVRGMLKSNSAIEVAALAKITGQPETFWSGRLYSLIGSDSIDGQFDGKVFTLEEKADIDAALDQLFEKYEQLEKGKIGKI